MLHKKRKYKPETYKTEIPGKMERFGRGWGKKGKVNNTVFLLYLKCITKKILENKEFEDCKNNEKIRN